MPCDALPSVCLRPQGQEVGKTDFHRRLLCIDKEIVGPRNAVMQQGGLDRSSQAFSVRSKPFWDLPAAQKVGRPSAFTPSDSRASPSAQKVGRPSAFTPPHRR